MSIEVIDPDSAAGIASAALEEALAALRQVLAAARAADVSATAAATARAAITTMLAALGVDHRWIGTSLQLRLPDGSYGLAVDLQGIQGEPGQTPTFHVGQVTTGPLNIDVNVDDPLNPIVDFTIPAGANGWTPVPAIVADGTRCVIRIVDWTGGTGPKPAAGQFVGPSGFVATASAGTDLRGLPGLGTVNHSGLTTPGHLAVFGSDGDHILDGGALTAFGASLAAAIDKAAAKALLQIVVGDVAGLGSAASLAAGSSAGNVPVLDGTGKLLASLLPALAISDTSVVGSQAAMLALTAERGDIAVRTDLNKSYILKADGASTLANWQELLTPTDAVLSVAGLFGSISASQLIGALGLAIGSKVQAWDTDLDAIAALSTTAYGRGLLTLASAAALTAAINAFAGDAGSGGTKGLVPAPAAGDAAAGKLLRADGTWAAAASGLQIGDKLDTFRAPGSSWLKRDGSYYLSSSYTVLAALLPGNGQSTLTQSFTEAVGGFNAITYSPTLGIFVAVGDNQAIYWSTDRVSWTRSTAPSGVTGNYQFVVWAAGLSAFALLSSTGFLATSTDGKIWTSSGQATTATPTMLFSGGNFVLLGFSSAGTGGLQYTLSLSSVSWGTVAPAPNFVVNTAYNFAGLFFLAGAGGNIVSTSSFATSGTTYTTRTSNTTQALNAMATATGASFGTVLCAVGANGALVTSPDGSTWTARATGLTNTLRAISARDGGLRLYGDGGQAATTPDLTTYNVQTLAQAYSIRGVISDGVNPSILAANNTGASPTAGFLYNQTTTGDPAKGATQFVVPSDQPASGTGYIKALAA